jgi:hypothetical protein
MSISISIPTLYNLSIGKNVITLSGITQSGLYAARVLINDVVKTTIEAPANSATVSHIDLSRILKSNLGDDRIEKISSFTNSNNNVLKYQINFGQKIGGSYSFTGTSSARYVINGYKSEVQLLWNYDTYLPSSNTHDECLSGLEANVRINTLFKSLTNYPHYNLTPSYTVYDDEYQTQTIINSISQSRSVAPGDDFNKHPWAVKYTFFSATGSEIGYNIKTINELNGAGPFTNSCSLGTFDTQERLLHIPTGPQNLKDWSIYNTNAVSYRASVFTKNNCLTCSTGLTQSGLNNILLDEIYRFDFKLTNKCSPFSRVRFSFRNAFGQRDYFTFIMRNTENFSIERQMFYKNVGTWNSASYTIDPLERGHSIYSTNVEQVFTAQTDFIDEDKSNWLRELFTSPEVMCFQNGEFIPVVITTASYEVKNYTRENLFRYTIEYIHSHKPQIQ